MPDIVGGLVGIAFLVLWFYCIYDVITTDDAIVRHLPKIVWLLIVVLLSDVGSILWLALGRPQPWTRQAHPSRRHDAPRSRPVSRSRPLSRPPAPEGALDHLNPIVRYREEQTRQRMLEAQLKRLEERAGRELGEGTSP